MFHPEKTGLFKWLRKPFTVTRDPRFHEMVATLGATREVVSRLFNKHGVVRYKKNGTKVFVSVDSLRMLHAVLTEKYKAEMAAADQCESEDNRLRIYIPKGKKEKELIGTKRVVAIEVAARISGKTTAAMELMVERNEVRWLELPDGRRLVYLSSVESRQEVASSRQGHTWVGNSPRGIPTTYHRG